MPHHSGSRPDTSLPVSTREFSICSATPTIGTTALLPLMSRVYATQALISDPVTAADGFKYERKALSLCAFAFITQLPVLNAVSRHI